jgi:preprotein translocase subunit SecD
MLNQYPWWKYLLIIAIIVLGIVYALPNVFGEDPAVQISSARASVTLDQSLHDRVVSKLDAEKLPYKRLEITGDRLLVRFADTDSQLKAADLLQETLGRDFVVALNLAPATPRFIQALGLQPMYLGLDLRGGVHFLMEVDMEAVLKQAEESYVDEVRSLLRNEKVRYLTVSREASGGIVISLQDTAEQDKAYKVLRKQLPNLQLSEPEGNQSSVIRLTLSEQEIREKRHFALQQNLTTLRNRVNELGVAEPVIQQQGESRIVVQLPGVQDTARAKEILGATATLEFRLVDQEHDVNQAAATGHIPVGSRLYKERDGRSILLQKRVLLTGDYITDAASGFDQQTGGPAVFITLDSQGARRFEDATKDNIGKLLAVVFIENKTETQRVAGELQKKSYTVEEVINVATIRDRLGRRFQITGLDSPQEARNLALLLRAGALAAPIQIVEERTVGPSAGQENIDQGLRSALISAILVIAFMAFYYRKFGMIANLALVLNMVLIIAALSMLQATLTLPGIAGIVLTIGMAVDANVLIYERIREEIRFGNTPQAAIHAGFDKAFSSILDANVTTLIAAALLFGFGTGPIKGFAVTLCIGLVTSMFTAIIVSRGVINYLYGGRRIAELSI